MTKGIVYYTDGLLDPTIYQVVRNQLKKIDIPTVSVTIGSANADFGQWVFLPLERGYLTMFKQILIGLETLSTDYVFLCEHDVLYHPSHFEHESDGLTYNQNVWKVDSTSGHAIHYPCSQTSGLSGHTSTLLEHYRRRVELVEKSGFSRAIGFEPGTHGRPERVDDLKSTTWLSALPNIDIRHTTNLTKTKTSLSDFRNLRYVEGWIESDSVPGWGLTEGRFDDFLKDLL